MNEFKKQIPEIPSDYIDKAIKEWKKKRQFNYIKEFLKEVIFKILGFILVLLVIFGIFTLIYRLEYYLEWKNEYHIELYFIFCFTACYIIISRADSIDEMHLIKNYKKPTFYYLFLSIALIGGFFCYDIFIKEKFAKSYIRQSNGGIEIMKVEYNTKKMCNYHLKRLYDELQIIALHSESEFIINKIYGNSEIKNIRSGNLAIEFNSYSDWQFTENIVEGTELVKVHIKIVDGIITINYQKIN